MAATKAVASRNGGYKAWREENEEEKKRK